MSELPSPRLTSLIEYGLYVADVEGAAAWYRRVFGFGLLMQEGDRLRALQAGERMVLLLFRRSGSLSGVDVPGGGWIPAHDGSGPHHIAFAMEKGDEERWKQHLQRHEISIESTVQWPEGGTSFYFRDPDGHLLELITPTQWRFKTGVH